MIRSGLLVLLVAALALASCNRGAAQQTSRANALNWLMASKPEDQDRGAAMMREHLTAYPHDAQAMTYLALHELRCGHRIGAEVLAECALTQTSDAQTAEHARGIVAAVDQPACATSELPEAPQVLAPLPIHPGKGVGNVVIGATLATVENELGPCRLSVTAAPTRICSYPERGVEVGLNDDQVRRVGVYRDSRRFTDSDFTEHRYRSFAGASPDGIRISMSKADLEARLGRPPERHHRFGSSVNCDGSVRTEVLSYPEEGMMVEIEVTSGGETVVGAIEIPKGLVGDPYYACAYRDQLLDPVEEGLTNVAPNLPSRTAAAHTDETRCSISLEERTEAQIPWYGTGVGDTEEQAVAKAVAQACDGLPASVREVCRTRAQRGYSCRGGGPPFECEQIVTKPESQIKASAPGQTQRAACDRAIALACGVAKKQPIAGAEVGGRACDGTEWYIYMSGNDPGGSGESARFD